MIRPFFICKNELFLKAIEPLLNDSNIAVAGICIDPRYAIDSVKSKSPGIVVMDATWDRYAMSGTELLQTLFLYDHSIKVILATNSYEPLLLKTYIELGIKGYFYRNADDIMTIVDCICRVHNGENCFVRPC